jgi:hypothetical protein
MIGAFGGTFAMRIGVYALIGALMLAGCSIQRAQVANEAQNKMIGLSKEQILACMGPPANRASEGATEVWSYNSGNGQTTAVVSGSQTFATAISTQRFCTVNVAMTNGYVSAVNYLGPTGGLITAGEQCAFAVQGCAR